MYVSSVQVTLIVAKYVHTYFSQQNRFWYHIHNLDHHYSFIDNFAHAVFRLLSANIVKLNNESNLSGGRAGNKPIDFGHIKKCI